MADYSGTPLVRKLGIAEGSEVFLAGAPDVLSGLKLVIGKELR